MQKKQPTAATGKTGGSDRDDRRIPKAAEDQRIMTFRDPEELRLARIAEYGSLREALDASITRSAARKSVALTLFPQAPDVKDPVSRAESTLAHKLGANHDQTFDLDLLLPALKLCTPDEQIDVLAFAMARLGLEVDEGRIRPKHRPSRQDAIEALRKDVGAFASAISARLDSIVGESEDE